jgi:hypothetical protein
MAGRASRDRFLAALDKVPASEPAPKTGFRQFGQNAQNRICNALIL